MAFSVRKYLGIDGSNSDSPIQHDNKANPLPEELLDRIDKDMAELIALICGAKKKPTNPTGQNPATKEDFKNNLNDAIKNGGLGEFYDQNDPAIGKLAEKAEELLKDPNYPLKDGNQIAVVARTCLYQIALYCDDSLSMTQETRIATQVTFARRFARLILPMKDGAINLRFINAAAPANGAWDNMSSADAIATAIQNVPYTGYTPIGGNLKSKVIEPMLYSQIANGYNKKIKPVAALIVTDGWPYNEADDHMRNVILESINRLKGLGYKRPENVIKYQINQIGHESRSTAFIQGLYNDQQIKPNVYCTSEILDDKIKELKDNEAGLDKWIVDKLSAEL